MVLLHTPPPPPPSACSTLPAYILSGCFSPCVSFLPSRPLPLFLSLYISLSLSPPSPKPAPPARSAVAFAGLSKDRENQSILVSGESGAGKTETVKILMGHLAVASSAISGDEGVGAVVAAGGGGGGGGEEGEKEGGNDDVIRKIIESNPLLESFGNAQTTRNDNSSR